jgi:hypothetical protein
MLIGTLTIALALGWWMDRHELRREVEALRVQLKATC